MNNKYKEIEKAFMLWKSGKQKPDKVPEGWFSAREYREAFNVSKDCACNRLRQMHEEGLLERKTYKVLTITGGLKDTPHYKICKSKKTR